MHIAVVKYYTSVILYTLFARDTRSISRDKYTKRKSLARCTISTLRLRLDEMIWKCVCVLVSLLILADSLFTDSEKLVVLTKWGFIRGKWSKTVHGRSVANYLGIPYALPPVGDLRFRSPQRWNRTWTTTRETTVDGAKCIQLNEITIIGSEDCLYLNVFVPNISDNRQRLPVLVFVHGGGFNVGSSDSKLYSPDYLLDQDIILVTMNYRLSALGFFSITNQVSGNYGIKDVKMALEWIQENIHSFEGNPNSVTLMGVSAGAAIVHILALSNKTEGLFHRYILHSGSALNTWSFHPPKRHNQLCLKLAKHVGCLQTKNNDIIALDKTTTKNPKGEVKDEEELMKCMRKIDAREIVQMTQYFSVWKKHPWCNIGPTMEDELSEDAILTKHPWKILKDGSFRDIPAIIQVVKDEGLMKSIELFRNDDVEKELIDHFEEYFPYFMEYHEVISNTRVFASAIQDFYFNGNVSLGLLKNITEVLSDGLITWPMFQSLQYQSEIGNSSIYFSFFAYEGTFSETFASGTPKHYGVCHGDDINYLFPILNNKYNNMLLHNTPRDITMINVMTEMWANFVKKGIPKAWQIPEWHNYRHRNSIEFMRIGNDNLVDLKMHINFLSDRMEFWKKLMLNKMEESVNDVSVRDLPGKDLHSNKADVIDRRLTIQLALLALILFYI